MTVSGIVVTYNRKESVKRCLDALLSQTFSLNKIIVIDNASTDGTLSYLNSCYNFELPQIKDESLISAGKVGDTQICLYRTAENGGGSLGFHLGMKIAYEQFDTDYYWMMDDDGYPSSDCLEVLLQQCNDNDYVMPTSINIKDHSKLAWAVRKKNKVKTISYTELMEDWGAVMPFVTPFNGALLSRKCLKEVGYVNKDFFIWGDEYEHYWRCKSKGIQPVTILNAKFYHPAQKLPLVKICFGLFTAPYVDSPLRMVCLARNYTYIYKHYGQSYKIPLKIIQYGWLFLITRHGDLKGFQLYLQSVRDGLKGNFTRHKKYLK